MEFCHFCFWFFVKFQILPSNRLLFSCWMFDFASKWIGAWQWQTHGKRPTEFVENTLVYDICKTMVHRLCSIAKWRNHTCRQTDRRTDGQTSIPKIENKNVHFRKLCLPIKINGLIWIIRTTGEKLMCGSIIYCAIWTIWTDTAWWEMGVSNRA